jgi:hypothetical protein
MGVVTTKDEIQAKLKSRGSTFMFVGYSFDHANDVYRILNLNSKRITQTRDVIWLVKCYDNWLKNKAPSNDNDMDEDIGNSKEEFLILNTKIVALKRIKLLKK